jgi:hypothetical protein
LAVFAVGRFQSGAGGLEPAGSSEAGQDIFECSGHEWVGGKSGEVDVEVGGVSHVHLEWFAGGERAELLGQLLEFGIGGSGDGGSGGGGFDHFSPVAGAFDLKEVQWCDLVAASVAVDQSFVFESGECGANGGAAGFEARFEGAFGQCAARAEFEREDGFAQSVVGGARVCGGECHSSLEVPEIPNGIPNGTPGQVENQEVKSAANSDGGIEPVTSRIALICMTKLEPKFGNHLRLTQLSVVLRCLEQHVL